MLVAGGCIGVGLLGFCGNALMLLERELVNRGVVALFEEVLVLVVRDIDELLDEELDGGVFDGFINLFAYKINIIKVYRNYIDICQPKNPRGKFTH